MDEKRLVEQLRTTAPSCLSGFAVSPAKLREPLDDNPCSVWRLACRCGGDTGRFLGHSLASLRPGLSGPMCFVSPLAFECGDCNAVTELLDTDRHGYEADIAFRAGESSGSAKIRGHGPRQAFACPGCGRERFAVKVGFVFWNPD